jgi:hypothetical protein
MSMRENDGYTWQGRVRSLSDERPRLREEVRV